MATGPSTKQPRVSVGGSSEIPLNVEETDLSKLAASIVAPSGKEEPCELKRLENGQTGWRTFFASPSLLDFYVITSIRMIRCNFLACFGGGGQGRSQR